MSHIHSLLAQSAAAQQLEYLERMRAAQLAEDQQKVRRKTDARSFDSMIDADGEAEDREQRETPEERQEPEDHSDTPERFGTRYA